VRKNRTGVPGEEKKKYKTEGAVRLRHAKKVTIFLLFKQKLRLIETIKKSFNICYHSFVQDENYLLLDKLIDKLELFEMEYFLVSMADD